MSAKLPSAIVRLATAEVGVTEEPPGSNCGPRVNQYKAATKLSPTQAWPWCAAFVDWIVREAMREQNVKETKTFKRPTTAGAWVLEQWSLDQDDSTHTKRKPRRDIEPGDIVIFTFSHVGIAIGTPDEYENFRTIEGNTDARGAREGGGVWRKWRSAHDVKTRIRFTV